MAVIRVAKINYTTSALIHSK